MAERASRRSGRGGPRRPLGDRRRRRRGLRPSPYPGRGAQRLRQGRLARDAQRRAVHAAEQGRAREAHRRNRYRRGCPRRRRAGWCERDRFRRRRAGLLDAQGRRPSGGLDPRRRLRRLAGGGLSGRERQDHADAEDFHGQASTIGLLAEVEAVERNEHATLVDARPPSYFSTARRRRRPPRPMATFRARSISTAPRSTIR